MPLGAQTRAGSNSIEAFFRRLTGTTSNFLDHSNGVTRADNGIHMSIGQWGSSVHNIKAYLNVAVLENPGETLRATKEKEMKIDEDMT